MKARLVPMLLALALLPTSTATWYGFGGHEPDNGLDSAAYQWADPPGTIRGRVYFQAYTSVDDTVNPNVGLLGSDIEPAGTEAHLAAFGVWVDCNQDGHIGMVETALREYDARLLTDTSVCPPTSGSPNSWVPGAHNYNGWVTELIPIAGRGARAFGDTRLYRDPLAMVWGDYGTPDYAFSKVTCTLRPFPTGTTRSTGGFLDYADCRVSQLLGDENDLASNYNGAMRATGDPLGLALPDDERWRGTGHVTDQSTFGSSSSEHAIVKVQDCDSEYIYNWGDLPGPLNDFDNRGIRSPGTDPDDVNLFGTVPGTVNYTGEAAPLPAQTGSSNSADCNATDDNSDEFYSGFGLVEGEHPGIPTNPKTKAHFNFNLSVTTRGGAPLGVLKSGSGGASSDGGIEAFESVCQICEASEWVSDWFPAKPNLQLVRGNLFTQDVRIASAYYITYYARVGPATTNAGLLLPGSTGIYGVSSCGEHSSGIHNGWNCDPDAWNFNIDGSPMNEHQPLARVGMPYHLRDVDCYDGTVLRTENGDLSAMPAAYGDDPCTPPN